MHNSLTVWRAAVAIAVFSIAMYALASCQGGAKPPTAPGGGGPAPKENAWVIAEGIDQVFIGSYEPNVMDIPHGYVALDSFNLVNQAGGDFGAPVRVTIQLQNPVSPGTVVYLYRLYPNGVVLPVASGIVGEDGRTVVFTLEQGGIYIILILHSQLDDASTFKAWAFADYALGPAPLEVNFNAFHERGIEPVTYHWDFGDGETATGASVSHTFFPVGDYNVVLTATDAGGRISVYSSTSVSVTTGIEPLDLTVQDPQPTGNPREFQFFSTLSGGLPPFTYHWDFGDGTTSDEENPVHQYAEPGIYRVSLTVSDSLGNVVDRSGSIHDLREVILNANPLAGPRNLDVVFSVTVQGDKLYPSEVTLDYGDGTINEIKHLYDQPSLEASGDYPRTYTVVSDYHAVLTATTIFEGTEYTLTDELDIVVGAAFPQLSSITPGMVLPGENVVISGSYFEDAMGSGSVAVGARTATVISWSDTQIEIGIPADMEFGTWDVVVTNDFGLASNPLPLVIDVPTPVLETISPASGVEGDMVTLTGLYFGDGTTGLLFWNGVQIAADTWADSQITFFVPPGTANGVVHIVRDGKTSNALPFTVLPTPPDWSPGGPVQL
ncbi:MAG: PKD domain-containing protein [bacterium]|jgi:hypothetical protein